MASPPSNVHLREEEEDIHDDSSRQTSSISDQSELTSREGLRAAQDFQTELLLRCVAPNAPVNNSPSFKMTSSSLVPTEDDLKQTCTYLAAAWGSPTRLAWVIRALLKQWSVSTVKVYPQDFQSALFHWAPLIPNMKEEEPLAACTWDGDLDTKYASDHSFCLYFPKWEMKIEYRGTLKFNGECCVLNYDDTRASDDEDRQAIMQRLYELWAAAPKGGGIRGGVHIYTLDDGDKLQKVPIRYVAPLNFSATPSQSRNYRGTLVFMRSVADGNEYWGNLKLPIPLLANLSTQLDFSVHSSLRGVSAAKGRFNFRTLLMYADTAHRLDRWHVMDSKPWGRPGETEPASIQLRLGLHFRFMVIQKTLPLNHLIGYYDGLSIRREQTVLQEARSVKNIKSDNGEHFAEKAVYAHCNILMTPYAPYNAIVLSDDRKWSHSDFVSFKNGSAIVAGKRTLGVAHFLMLIQFIYRDIETEWQSTLDRVGRELSVPLADVSDEWVWNHFMGDKSLDHSKKYLRFLQVFRVMREWIVQNMRGLENLREDFFREITSVGYDEDEIDLMRRNWAIVMEDVRHRTAVIQESIRMRAEEIKELQDGLFNTTSLREASKGMRLNKAIYVFTVVTIIFTPIGFLATFFALPHLNNENDAGKVEAPRGFTISFITIPLATYGTCAAMAYVIGSGNMDRFLRTRYMRWVLDAMQRSLKLPYYTLSVTWILVLCGVNAIVTRIPLKEMFRSQANTNSANYGRRSTSLSSLETAV